MKLDKRKVLYKKTLVVTGGIAAAIFASSTDAKAAPNWAVNASNPASNTTETVNSTIVTTNTGESSEKTANNSAETNTGESSEKTANNPAETNTVDSSEKTANNPAETNTVESSEKTNKDIVDNNTSKKVIPASSKLNEEILGYIKEAGIDLTKLTEAQIEELNKAYVKEDKSAGTRLTYKNLRDVVSTFLKQDGNYTVPYFKADTIKNMQAMHTIDAQTMEEADLDIWDSWPVQDMKTGEVSNWNGYQLVIAMAGTPNRFSNHLYLLYNEYGNNDFNSWKNAGPIFGYNADQDEQQWSGSAAVNKDGSIQLYYTNNDTHNFKLNEQRLATATINLIKENNKLVIGSVENNKILFSGDGKHYQNYTQFISTFNDDLDKDGKADKIDNYTLRDPHVIEVDGSRYLVFEANTGTENYQGEHQIYNLANYGNNKKDQITGFLNLTSNEEAKKIATWANGAIGILKLNDNEKNPSVEEVYSPLITAAAITDEIERPSVVPLNNKYYLFTASRIGKSSDIKGTVDVKEAVYDDVVMLGFVSDSLRGKYTPLNNSSVVLTASVPASWRTSTYSYYAVPVKGYNDRVLITSYMTNRGEVAGVGTRSTWAPSFIVKIYPDNTTKVLAKMTEQGDWIWDETSQSDHHVGNIETARLANETYYVDWTAIGKYGIRNHESYDENNDISKKSTVVDIKLPNGKIERVFANIQDKPVDLSKNNDRKILPKTGATTTNNVGLVLGLVGALLALRKNIKKN